MCIRDTPIVRDVMLLLSNVHVTHTCAGLDCDRGDVGTPCVGDGRFLTGAH